MCINLKLATILVLIFTLVQICESDETGNEPTCLSRFDYDYKMLSKMVQLEAELGKLQTTIAEQKNEIKLFKEQLKSVTAAQERDNAQFSTLQTMEPLAATGVTYTRWGRTTCPGNGTELVYSGYIGGSHYSQSGSGSNYLCLPEVPVWGAYEDGVSEVRGYVFGGEYQTYEEKTSTFFEHSIHDLDAPCAVCRTKRASVLMIPATNTCYDGWTEEYNGYLVSDRYNHASTSTYECLDVEPEVISNSGADLNGNLVYLVEARCGSLPCPPYVEGRELTCVVCSK